MRSFLLIAFALLSLNITFKTQGSDDTSKIAMILWRGETSAEISFKKAITENKDISTKIEIFNCDQDKSKLISIIEDLKSKNFDLIYSFGTTVTKELKKSITKTPIVFNIVSRPIKSKLIKSWESSGNNLTGASNSVPMSSVFRTLFQVMQIRKLGFIYNANETNSQIQRIEIEKIRKKFGFKLYSRPFTDKTEIPQVIIDLLDNQVSAVLLPSDSLIKKNATEIISHLNKHRIPTITSIPKMVSDNNALLGLGPNYSSLGKFAAESALSIINGKKPSELKIRRVDNLKITVNRHLANKFGINVPLQLMNASIDSSLKEEKNSEDENFFEKSINFFFSTKSLLVFKAIIPSFIIALFGFLLGRLGGFINQVTISNLIFYIFSPCLIFSSIHKRVFNSDEFLLIMLSVLALIMSMFPFVYFLKKAKGIKETGVYLPVIFMSTGTISLPIALLLYGNEGLGKAVIFHLINVLAFYSVGVYIAGGKPDLKQILKIPALYAAILGVIISVVSLSGLSETWLEIWYPLERGIDIIGYGAIPLLIISFGHSISVITRKEFKSLFSFGLLRVLVGPVIAFILIYIYRETGLSSMEKGYDLLSYLDLRTTEAVIILNAAMPGPVMAYMLAHKFKNAEQKTVAILTVSTIISFITIPIVLQLVSNYILK